MPILPLRLYAEIAAALILVVAGVWFVHHERQIGAAKVTAVQQAADLKEKQHVDKVNADATATINDLQVRLSTALAVPPQPAFVVRVCPSAPSAPRGLPSDAPPSSGSNEASGTGGGVGSLDLGADIAPATEAVLSRDKAMIDYLQGYIEACQRMGNCAK